MKLSHPSDLLPQLPRGAEVLILRLRSLGDVVMLTPALAALHAWRPDLRLSVLVEPAYVPVLEGNPAVAQTLRYEGFASCVAMLRRRRFPIVFNQHAGPTSALLAALAGIPVRVCWEGFQFSFLYNVLAPPAAAFFGDRKVHTVEHRLTQFYCAGLPQGPIPPAQVFPQPDATASVGEKLARSGVAAGAPYAVMHCGASAPEKRWTLDGFAEVARWLREERGITPVLRLGPGEQGIAAAVRQAFGAQAVVFDTQALDLRETIALVAGARLFVGNDSGPAHLATAAACPAVVIFGATDPATWRPWQVPHRVVASDPGYAFAGPRGILSVTVEQVRRACSELLDETRAGRQMRS